ncbi:MAG TPA: proprotein convertase P-domain-containing protein, partial [Kofleriaceae bacterium]|nr:proprotein convertase P-domain-containing protein [Kofleriaceae bacterium]
NLAIPDNVPAGVNSYISVAGSGTITSLRVSVCIKHSYSGDLVVTLYSPAGSSYVLWNRAGGSADDVLINDLTITSFNGQTAAGSWRLNCSDQAGADVGTLKFWAVTLRTNLDDAA